MSRVDGEPPPAAQEAERAAKEADKRSRDAKLQEADRQAFGKLLAGQKESRESSTKQTQQQGEARQAEQKGQAKQKAASDGARMAQLARGGIAQHSRVMEQAKGFQGALEQTQQKASTDDKARVTTRDNGKKADRIEREDRQGELVQKAEARREADTEKARIEAKEADRPNAAISSDRNNDGGGDGKPQDDGSAAAAAAMKKQPQLAPAQAAQAKHEVKQIPPEMLEKLVSTVYLAVTEKGLKEFQIELKDGVLKGAFLKITAEDGKVGLSFSGLDTHTKNLVESSKGDLMRRLEKKGLRLARLDVK